MKKALLVLLFFIPTLTFSQAIDLFQQFNGRYDFTAFGNTLNEEENCGTCACTILTESTAGFTLFPNQTIVSAHLYWAGPGDGDFDVELNGTPVSAQRTFSLVAATGLNYFAAYADVSPLVTGTGQFTLSELDLTAVIGPYCGGTTNFGGWSIIVIYEDPALTLNQISLFDGLDYVSAQQQSLEIILTNIDISTDELAKIGFLAWEGDRNIANNETLLINGILIDNPPLNPGDNAFNGTNSYTGSDQLYNMDLDFYDLENIVQPGDTQVTINLTSSQDFVMVNNLITSVNSEIPDATIVIDNIGVLCQNRDLEVNYTVFNVNSTAPLDANTPIAFYADNVLIGQTQTVGNIAIDGSESGMITLNLPFGTPVIFDLKAVVDDIGDGTGIVAETDESNNEFILEVDLSEQAQFLGPDIDSCDGMTVTLDTGIINPLFTFQWFFNGVLIVGETGPTLDVTVDGVYSCIASEGACEASDNVAVEFHPQPFIEGEPLDLFQCDDGVSTGVFDLTENEDDILGGQDPALFVFKYYETLLDSQNDTNAILGPTAHLIVPPSPQTIFVRVEDLSGTCTAFTEFDIYFTVAVAGDIPLPFFLCDQDEDGVEPIDLPMEFDDLILNGEDPLQYNITYHNSQADADNSAGALPVPYLVNVPGETVYARIENLDDIRCYDTEDIELIVEQRPAVNETPDPLINCDDDGFSEFDLTLADLDITGGDPNLTVSYHGTLLDAQNNLLPITGLYPNDDIYNDSVWARVESSVNTCYETVELFLVVREIPEAVTPAEPLRLCDDAVADGFTFFDLTVVRDEVLGGLSPTEYDLYYYVLESDAIAAGDLALTAPDFSLAIPDP
ncbi:MAG: CARDB domain-containing protein, partial [Bacteroidota bacterium]